MKQPTCCVYHTNASFHKRLTETLRISPTGIDPANLAPFIFRNAPHPELNTNALVTLKVQ